MLSQPSCFHHSDAKLRPTHFLAFLSSSNPISNIHNVLASFSPTTLLDVRFIYLASFHQPHLQKNNPNKKISIRLLNIHCISALLIQQHCCVPLILPTN